MSNNTHHFTLSCNKLLWMCSQLFGLQCQYHLWFCSYDTINRIGGASIISDYDYIPELFHVVIITIWIALMLTVIALVRLKQIITARVRSTREGNVFSLLFVHRRYPWSLAPGTFLGQGYPWSLVSGPFLEVPLSGL